MAQVGWSQHLVSPLAEWQFLFMPNKQITLFSLLLTVVLMQHTAVHLPPGLRMPTGETVSSSIPPQPED